MGVSQRQPQKMRQPWVVSGEFPFDFGTIPKLSLQCGTLPRGPTQPPTVPSPFPRRKWSNMGGNVEMGRGRGWRESLKQSICHLSYPEPCCDDKGNGNGKESSGRKREGTGKKIRDKGSGVSGECPRGSWEGLGTRVLGPGGPWVTFDLGGLGGLGGSLGNPGGVWGMGRGSWNIGSFFRKHLQRDKGFRLVPPIFGFRPCAMCHVGPFPTMFVGNVRGRRKQETGNSGLKPNNSN